MVIKKVNAKIEYPELALVLLLSYSHIAAGIEWITTGIAGRVYGFITTAFQVLVAILILVSFVKCFRRIQSDSIMIVILFAVLYFFSMMNPDTYYEVMRQGLLESTFLDGIPVYILFRLCINYDSIWKYVKYSSWLILSVYSVAFMVYDVGHVYRSFSAGLVIAAGYFVTDWLYNDKRSMLLPGIVSVVLLTIGGRRSSLIAVFMGIMLILFLRKDYKKIIWGILIIAVIYFLYETIIDQLYALSVSMHVNSRVLLKIMSGNAAEDSHRFEQWSYVLQLVFSSPANLLLGLGIAGERHYLLTHFAHMQLQGYPHGILVEMIGHYGVVLGVLLNILLFVIMPVKTFKTNDTTGINTIFIFNIILASALLFQDSYLQNRYFFLYIAIMVTCLWRKKGKLIWGR